MSTVLLTISINAFDITPVRIRYEGGDWYNDPEALTRLAFYINSHTEISMDTAETVLRIDDKRIFNYPFLFITGHGDFIYNEKDIEHIKTYLNQGGFIYIDDDFGFNRAIMRFIGDLSKNGTPEKVYDDNQIFNSYYKLDQMPKIHEHYAGNPESYALYINDKIALFYTFNTNISDGWSTPELHNDPVAKKEDAYKMGVNIIYYALFK